MSSAHDLHTFKQLTQLLSEHRSLWTESAFTKDTLSWVQEYSNLSHTLLSLSECDVTELDKETKLLHFLEPYIPGLALVSDWTIPAGEGPPWKTSPRVLFGLPGRKKQQTEGFVRAILPLLDRLEDHTPRNNIVDWCSGRGLLARQLQEACQSHVICLERDQSLCTSGHGANAKLKPPMSDKISFVECDVLNPLDRKYFESSCLHTALHACGDLHVSMLQQAAHAKVPLIACSPCCYHLTKNNTYQALSQHARSASLKLTRSDLRLATAEIATAKASEQSLRQRELLWRIAFDLRLRQLNNYEVYTPTPSIKKSLLKTNFEHYAQAMTKILEKKGISSHSFLPLSPSEQKVLFHQAKSKLARIKRLEKAQLGFRKAMECWLLLDRVLFLQEQGYRVQLRQFCSKQDSGRNIIILGSPLS